MQNTKDMLHNLYSHGYQNYYGTRMECIPINQHNTIQYQKTPGVWILFSTCVAYLFSWQHRRDLLTYLLCYCPKLTLFSDSVMDFVEGVAATLSPLSHTFCVPIARDYSKVEKSMCIIVLTFTATMLITTLLTLSVPFHMDNQLPKIADFIVPFQLCDNQLIAKQ